MDTYINNREEIIKKLKVIWDYMGYNMPIEKSDLIIGCGSLNLGVPKKCAELYKNGIAPLILFAGGFGKVSQNYFPKTEAEIFRDIAIENGVPEDKILLEKTSVNTRDNIRFAKKILKKHHINPKKIIIVHGPFVGRRVSSTVKKIMRDKDVIITSPLISFDEYINILDSKPDNILNNISVIVGDIQRLIIYPKLGWQIENEIPQDIIDAYYYLQSLGFTKYIYTREQIKILYDKYNIPEDKRVYFV